VVGWRKFTFPETMTKGPRTIVFVLLLVLVVLAGVGIRLTSNPEQPTNTGRRWRNAPPEQQVYLDLRALEAAEQLSKTATTREEDQYGRESARLADHEVDLAFTTALRDSQLHPMPVSDKGKELRIRVHEFEEQLKSDQAEIKRLSSSKTDESDQLDLLHAQMNLHQEELEDAQQDLVRAGDDMRSRIQRMLDTHEASAHATQSNTPQPTVRLPQLQVPDSMVAQAELWKQLHDKKKRLLEAQQASSTFADALDRKHDAMEQRLKVASVPEAASTAQAAKDNSPAKPDIASVNALRVLSEDRKTLSEYDKRIQDEQQLAQVYGNWAAVVGAQQTRCVNGLLRSAVWILLIAIFVLAADAVLDRFYRRLSLERRQASTLRLVARFGVRLISVFLLLFVLLGPPSQLSTIIGLAGAGLTVALKDFIVGFFGWFVLMGKNGIRVGDWVEINGIGGEVVEIGLLRTVLLETGNWTDSGHPTGRRVTFVNSFAIEGHYFNFSTAGQWLWDTLEVLVPNGQDPYPITDAILRLVTSETEESARLAEQEWQRARHKYDVHAISAAPGVNVRPSGQGINIIVRYITRANERYQVRTRLYQNVVEILQHRDITPSGAMLAQAKAAESGKA
jgi:small-conductance mechanosensitive channel